MILTSVPRLAAALLLTLGLGVTGCAKATGEAKDPSSGKGASEGHAEVGKAAPDLSIQTLNGKGKFSLEAKQGKVVIVDFWATWCAPCKKSFPRLEELSKRSGDKVEIIGISVDDDKAGVLDFAKETGATFPIAWDDGHTIAERWKLGTMPTTFIVDTSGKVRHVHDGYHDGEIKLMEKELAAILDEGGGGESRVAKSEDGTKGRDDAATSTTGRRAGGTDETTGSTAAADTAATKDDAATTDDDTPPPPKKKPAKKKPAKKPLKKKPAKKPAPASDAT